MKNLDFILHLKHWHVFLILCLAGLFKSSELEEGKMLTAICMSAGVVLYSGWQLAVGHRLYHYFPGMISWSYRAFLFSTFFLIGSMIVFPLVKGYPELSLLYSLKIPWAICIFFAGIHGILFASKMIESVDSGKEVTVLESIGVFLLILVLPVGIWFLQPMVNRSMQKRLLEQSVQQ